MRAFETVGLQVWSQQGLAFVCLKRRKIALLGEVRRCPAVPPGGGA